MAWLSTTVSNTQQDARSGPVGIVRRGAGVGWNSVIAKPGPQPEDVHAHYLGQLAQAEAGEFFPLGLRFLLGWPVAAAGALLVGLVFWFGRRRWSCGWRARRMFAIAVPCALLAAGLRAREPARGREGAYLAGLAARADQHLEPAEVLAWAERIHEQSSGKQVLEPVTVHDLPPGFDQVIPGWMHGYQVLWANQQEVEVLWGRVIKVGLRVPVGVSGRGSGGRPEAGGGRLRTREWKDGIWLVWIAI